MKKNDESGDLQQARSHLRTTLLLLLAALLSMVAASAAWFSIADRAQVKSLSMDVTAGPALRFDLDAHKDFEEYTKTLTFQEIADRVEQDLGYDMKEIPLEPVTTQDWQTFTYKNGTQAEEKSGVYLTFTLHFCALKDMDVHLTSANSQGNADGTSVSSENEELPQAMRISFTADGETKVYDPGMDAGSEDNVFGLPSASGMEYNDGNTLFSLKAEEDKEVTVHVWLEGTDEACTDQLKGADYSIQLRFEGTDDEGKVFQAENETNQIEGET